MLRIVFIFSLLNFICWCMPVIDNQVSQSTEIKSFDANATLQALSFDDSLEGLVCAAESVVLFEGLVLVSNAAPDPSLVIPNSFTYKYLTHPTSLKTSIWQIGSSLTSALRNSQNNMFHIGLILKNLDFEIAFMALKEKSDVDEAEEILKEFEIDLKNSSTKCLTLAKNTKNDFEKVLYITEELNLACLARKSFDENNVAELAKVKVQFTELSNAAKQRHEREMEYYNECRRDIQTIHNKLLEAEREATGWGLVLKDVVAGVSDVVSNIFGSKKSEKNVNDVENVVNGAEKIVNGAKNVASGEDNIINDAKDVVKVAENVVNGAKDVVNDAENIVNGVKNIGDSANKISGDKNNIDENNVNERRKRDRNRDVRRNLEERHRQEKERLDKQRKEIDENNVNERRKRDLPSDRNRDVRRSLEARYKQEKDRLDKQRKEIDLVEEQIANFTAMVKNTDLERMDLEKVIEFISEATKYLILLHDKWSEMYKHFTRISIVIEENIVNKAGKIEDLEEVQKKLRALKNFRILVQISGQAKSLIRTSNKYDAVCKRHVQPLLNQLAVSWTLDKAEATARKNAIGEKLTNVREAVKETLQITHLTSENDTRKFIENKVKNDEKAIEAIYA